jgi:putative transposase
MYCRHRFPGEIMGYCVWLYYTFPLSYRDIEKMMLVAYGVAKPTRD